MLLIIKPSLSAVALHCSCPPSCTDCDKKPITWYHGQCQKKAFITVDGDIDCQQPQCQKFFIQHASFKCKTSSTGYKYRSASEFLMALAQGLQAAEFSLDEQDLLQFTQRINENVRQRWNS